MKKARVFLTAIAVFAVVGGAMAFKSAKGTFTYFCSNPFIPQLCNVPVQAQFTLNGNDGAEVRCSITPTFNNAVNCQIDVAPAL